MAKNESINRELTQHFEEKWSKGDPWQLGSSEYERLKYLRQIELLNDQRYGRVLEIGCAAGDFTRMLAAISDTVVGIDIAPSAIALAKAAGIPPGVEFRAANAMEFDLVGEGPWDLVVLSETIPYLGWLYPLFNVGWMATQLHEAMAEGGRLMMADLSGGVRNHMQQPWMIRTYRDLMVNVGFQREFEELYHGHKEGMDLEVTITRFRRGL